MSPLAETASLLADRTRAAFCLALLDGRAWTAGELARHAGVRPSTASEHLSRLVTGGLLAEERQGRHRYVRLAGPEAAALVEALTAFPPTPEDVEDAEDAEDHGATAGRAGASVSDGTTGAGAPVGVPAHQGAEAAHAPARTPVIRATSHIPRAAATARPRSLRAVTRHEAEARARTCYDHLAGRLGVALAVAAVERGLVDDRRGLALTPAGLDWLTGDLGYAPAPGNRRPLVRSCLDWTERRPHLAGALGATLCATALERSWVRRIGSGRAVRITPAGVEAFHALLGVRLAP